MIRIFITKDTALPPFIPLPQFMVSSEHSVNAKLLYGLLLHRTMLSQKNGWVDEEGKIYIIYPIKQMANDLNRCATAVKAALVELEAAGLLRRVRQGLTKANLLYLLLPDDLPDGRKSDDQDGQKSDDQDGRKSDRQESRKTATSNTDIEYTDRSRKKVERSRRRLGAFENVFLSEDEYSALQTDFPDRYGEYIDRLSRYMAANDRHYANHYAVLLKWLDEDNRGKATRNYTYDDYNEGDCL